MSTVTAPAWKRLSGIQRYSEAYVGKRHLEVWHGDSVWRWRVWRDDNTHNAFARGTAADEASARAAALEAAIG